jgi:hypothetical protein
MAVKMAVLLLALLAVGFGAGLLLAQEFEFEFQPEAFPLEMNGWQPFSPWSGGVGETNPAIVDIDDDSDLDFFVGEISGMIRYYINNGIPNDPSFGFVTTQFASIIMLESRANPCFGDLDTDGDVDLIVGDIDANVHFYRNIGTPAAPVYFLEESNIVPVTPWCVAPELIDIDDDGDYDLFGGWTQICFYRNEGTPDTFDFVLETSTFEGINVTSSASVEFVDIDADNDYDLFIGNSIGRLWYYRNDGDSINYDFTYVTDYFDSIEVGSYASPEFADIDDDGDYDLFVGRESTNEYPKGDIFFYENIGTPTNPNFELITENYLSLDLFYFPITVKAADINTDLAPDLFIGVNYSISYFTNSGDSANPYYILDEENFQNINHTTIFPFFVDIDADGDSDLMCGEGFIPGPPEIALYINRGTPQMPVFVLHDSTFVTNPDFDVNACPSLADIDEDNDYDLFVTDNGGHLFYYQNDGNPEWPSFTLMTNQWQGISWTYPHESWRPLAFADLDEDTDLDFLIPNINLDNLAFYRNYGNPSVPVMQNETEEFLEDPPGFSIFSPYLVDIDTDSDYDLFIGDVFGGVLFYRNTTGDTSAVNPRIAQYPLHGIELSFGPNPANPVTWVSFNLPYPQKAELAVYNLLGQKVATLASGHQMPGTRTYFWNATNTSSGTYFIRLETEKTEAVQRVVVLR